MMKLITKELIKRFQEVGDQSEVEDPLLIAKFFDPCGSWTWFATEYDPKTNICDGYVKGFQDEWGSFSITELEAVQRPFGLTIERDIHFSEIPFSQLTMNKRLEELQDKGMENDRDTSLEQ